MILFFTVKFNSKQTKNCESLLEESIKEKFPFHFWKKFLFHRMDQNSTKNWQGNLLKLIWVKLKKQKSSYLFTNIWVSLTFSFNSKIQKMRQWKFVTIQKQQNGQKSNGCKTKNKNKSEKKKLMILVYNFL